MKKFIICIILIIAMALPLSATGVDWLAATCTTLQPGSVGGDWTVIALARSGADFDADAYYRRALDFVSACEGVLHKTRMTEYARVALAIAAIGRNPMDVGGYDILSPLLDFDAVTRQGLNAVAWAMAALDCGCARPDGSDAVIEQYISYILEKQEEDGRICDLPGSEVEFTAAVVRVLNKYSDRPEVQAAIDAGVDFILSSQGKSGGFPSKWGESSEPISQVIITLTALGITPDETLTNALESYKNADGGYAHSPGGDTDLMATEQAALANVALARHAADEPPLLDYSDVTPNDAPLPEIIGLPGKSDAVNPPKIVSSGVTFSDLINEATERRAAAEYLASRGIITGYTDGTFRPDNNVTRAEFATLIVRALGLEADVSTQNFTDVSRDKWYFSTIETAHAYRIVNGVGGGLFDPDGSVTRQQAATMLARAATLCGLDTSRTDAQIRDTLSPFADYTKSASWARQPMAFCVDADILDGDALTLRPEDPATRGELAIMLRALLAAAKLL